MGCLNSQGNFEHWFGNIHLSGPCNRACYFCIGQHMMALDPLNNLDEWPLKNIDSFIAHCLARNINDINITGSNTDPLMYRHMERLRDYLHTHIPNLKFGIRTNGVLALSRPHIWRLFDKGSISITSLDPDLYVKTMGIGRPPDIEKIVKATKFPLKANIVLCQETVQTNDWKNTIYKLIDAGIKTINLREPYGQPHIGNPFKQSSLNYHLGMPQYQIDGAVVTYWDVHYVAVESVNLYANGRVSETYPITKGHHETGIVRDQSQFLQGRQQEQWLNP